MKAKFIDQVAAIKNALNNDDEIETKRINFHKISNRDYPLTSIVFDYLGQTSSVHYEESSMSMTVYQKKQEGWKEVGGLPFDNSFAIIGKNYIEDIVSSKVIPFIKENCKPQSVTRLEKINKVKEAIDNKCIELFQGLRKTFIKFYLDFENEEIRIGYQLSGIGTNKRVYFINRSFGEFFDDERFDEFDLFEEIKHE